MHLLALCVVFFFWNYIQGQFRHQDTQEKMPLREDRPLILHKRKNSMDLVASFNVEFLEPEDSDWGTYMYIHI